MLENPTEVQTIPSGTDRDREAYRSFWSDSNWRILHCLLQFDGNKSITELSTKVSMPVDDVVEALEGLETLGYIKKTANGFEVTQNEVRRRPADRREKAEQIADFGLAAQQINNHLMAHGDNPTAQPYMLIYNSKKELVEELQSKIRAALDDFKMKSDSSSDWDGVYSIYGAQVNMISGGSK